MSAFLYKGKTIHAEDEETVLSALLREGVEVSHRCQAGACQSCMVRATGAVPTSAQRGLDEELVERGVFLSCQAKANSVDAVEPLGTETFPRFPVTLLESRRATDDVLIVRFGVYGWNARPGRFIRLIHNSGTVRPYSLATPAWDCCDQFDLHVRLIPGGEMSEVLRTSDVGSTFAIEGPFGRCVYRSTSGDEPIVLVGSGTGLAPLYGIATDALHQGHRGPIHLYHGAANSSGLYFQPELRQLAAAYPTFRYIPCADETNGITSLREGSPLAAALADHPSMEGYRAYLCGHPDLVRAAQKKCFLAGVNLRDIAADPFEAA